MPKIFKVWRWPQFLHGQGHSFYQSKEAKELYAKQLISLSEKIFWLLFAPLFGYFLNPEQINIIMLGVAILVLLCIGLYLRHQGLKIIDDLQTRKIAIEIPTNSR